MVEKETMKKRRKKGDGSITMKENGTYLGRITIAGYEPFSCTGATKKEVERKDNSAADFCQFVYRIMAGKCKEAITESIVF